MSDGEDTYEALHSRVETFWLVCRDALIGAMQSEANFTCSEVEALTLMLEGIIDESDLADLVSAHAAWSDASQAGDCECDDEHHQIWVDAWGPCPECGLTPNGSEAAHAPD